MIFLVHVLGSVPNKLLVICFSPVALFSVICQSQPEDSRPHGLRHIRLTLGPLHLILNPGSRSAACIPVPHVIVLLLDLLCNVHHLCGGRAVDARIGCGLKMFPPLV